MYPHGSLYGGTDPCICELISFTEVLEHPHTICPSVLPVCWCRALQVSAVVIIPGWNTPSYRQVGGRRHA